MRASYTFGNAARLVHGMGSTLLAVVIVATTVLGTARAADSVDPDRPTMTVSLRDLDLSSVDGMRIANERLRKAARRLCMRLIDELDLGYQPHFVACVDQAAADARRQLITRQLAAREAH